jgi:peptidyl-dipeptidase A
MSPDRRTFLLTGGAAVSGLLTPQVEAAHQPADPTTAAKDFLTAHVTKMRPLEVAANIAWWDANVTGSDDAFKKKEDAQNKIDDVLSNTKKFETLKGIKAANDAGKISDPLLARQVNLLYLMYLEKQVPPELLKKITAKANSVEQTFNIYRAKVDGKELTDSRVRTILKESNDSAMRQKVWESSKGVGKLVEGDLRELVKLRNDAAQQLKFENFHAMMLVLNEQNGPELIKLFDDLDELTSKPFLNAKEDIDFRLARRYTIKSEELMPWHYHDPFFQESPAVFDSNIDAPYAKADLMKLCRDFYAGIGLPIDRAIAKSDLLEKKGKSPHAFCTDIDREGDVRVLANIVNNEYWMGTLLHEFGHSVYSSLNIPQSLPYLVRCESHILTTEGVAMQFERFSKSLMRRKKFKGTGC